MSLGSRQFGLRPSVFLDSRILEAYQEVEPTLGLNTAGVIFSVLSAGRVCNPVKPEDCVLTVRLLHRENRHPVELELEIQKKQVAHRRRVVLLGPRGAIELPR